MELANGVDPGDDEPMTWRTGVMMMRSADWRWTEMNSEQSTPSSD